MHAPDTLTKLYVEITTECNLDCQMCIRHGWHEPLGTMPLAVFEDLMRQVRAFDPVPTIHLGGYGEPTFHTHFLDIVRAAKATGARVEMTTNGMLLNLATSEALIEAGMDRIVVSIDGASETCYEDIRTYGDLDFVINNIRTLQHAKVRMVGRHGKPQVGLAFVAMKRNIHELPALPMLATRIGASDISVSNVVPHTPEMEAEILYEKALNSCAYRASPWVVDVSLPKFDMNAQMLPIIGDMFHSSNSISLLDASLSARDNYCRFVQQGYSVIRWDGEVSPCLPLLHDHRIYLRHRSSDVSHQSYGSIKQTDLADIWHSEDYAAYRQKVRDFPFSPCTTCGGCDLFAENRFDCSDQSFPVCGRCLWAQGFVQCP